jgi:protein-tyrosine phosphatase
MRLLFVCTGNLCRSPVAGGLALAWARESLQGSPELALVEVLSAGTEAAAGRSMDASSAVALRQLGGDPEEFVSRQVTPDLLEGADLVLTMTRDQRREVLRMAPRGLRRTFTLTEAADLLARADLRGLRTMPLAARARELGRRLDAARAFRMTADVDDLTDPVGRGPEVHEATARGIATALRPLADILFTSVRTQPAVPVPT